MLNVIMLRAIMSNVANNPFMQSVVMLSVVAPHCSLTKGKNANLKLLFRHFY